MSRVICVLIGYLFGNFLTAEVVSKHISRESAFDRGTGNPGMANMVHEYGVKNGALVLIGDLLKAFIPCLLCRLFLFPEMGATAAAYAGLGVILGHNFPCWHHFHGGKGVTCTCAAIVSISFGYGLLACIVGLIGVLISHYLPVGAVLIPLAFLIPVFRFYGKEVGILTLIMALLMLQRHFSGLKNIRTGKEPRKDLLKGLRKEKTGDR
ncbi:MAG: glycerol-3-phosphate acyltransferase [Lachnospiraceae bacterium]|nr:glycerol-3-phosphate acyltransferase [Lachnospiraceae bacterium]